ncbi:MAG TPA: tannase/feruloyl esterase family alpha/beta hydrolase [Vicinamibacterales bacterium]|nr:tannase/feruloyl esterase family alpha/beta hydrolase [Vicinamibacterales bacterium]
MRSLTWPVPVAAFVRRVACATSLCVLALHGAPLGAAGTPCTALGALTIPNVSIVSASPVPAGPFTAPGSAGGQTLAVPALCRVVAVATPTADSHINFEVWIPEGAGWNGKFQGVGTGGFAGSISYGALAEGARRGYATASTDTGHTGDDLRFGSGHPERIVDWAYRSIHLMTEAGKLIVRNHTGRFPDRAYFNGCATGGHQAMMEVQRFPADYDGVVAGNPAADRTNEIIAYLWDWRATHTPDGASLVDPAKLRLLTASAVAACDANDGVKDGVVDDPRQCRFDPASLRCPGAAGATCLTSAELGAVRAVYDGPRNPRTGEQIFPGWPLGSEGYGAGANDGWRNFLDVPEPRRVGLFRYFLFDNPAWDWWTFDWDRDVAFTNRALGFLNATDPDLRPYRDRGGRIVMHTGWVDPILPAPDVIKYYEEVTHAMGGSAETQRFFRLFLAPGMGHCSGGPGPNTLDALTALERWVEQGEAPEQITATRRAADGVAARTRPLCAYPKVARWSGRGSTDDAASFACVDPER